MGCSKQRENQEEELCISWDALCFRSQCVKLSNLLYFVVINSSNASPAWVMEERIRMTFFLHTWHEINFWRILRRSYFWVTIIMIINLFLSLVWCSNIQEKKFFQIWNLPPSITPQSVFSHEMDADHRSVHTLEPFKLFLHLNLHFSHEFSWLLPNKLPNE